MSIPSPSFRCELRRDNGSAAVIVDGELEEISAVQLAAACLQARDVAGDVVLDLGGLSFADGTGIKMIETIHRSFGRSGHRLTVVHPIAPRPGGDRASRARPGPVDRDGFGGGAGGAGSVPLTG